MKISVCDDGNSPSPLEIQFPRVKKFVVLSPRPVFIGFHERIVIFTVHIQRPTTQAGGFNVKYYTREKFTISHIAIFFSYFSRSQTRSSSVDADEIRRLGKRFKKLDLDNSGALSIDEFMSLPELQQNPLVQRVIDIFDADGNGEVDFKEFIHGVSQFSVKGDKLSKLKFAFRIYDMDNDGFISNGELFQVSFERFQLISPFSTYPFQTTIAGVENDGGKQPEGRSTSADS